MDVQSSASAGPAASHQLVVQILDLVSGGGPADPCLELIELGAAGDASANVVGHRDAAGVENRQQCIGYAFRLALGLALAEVSVGELALVAIARDGHEPLQLPSRRSR